VPSPSQNWWSPIENKLKIIINNRAEVSKIMLVIMSYCPLMFSTFSHWINFQKTIFGPGRKKLHVSLYGSVSTSHRHGLEPDQVASAVLDKTNGPVVYLCRLMTSRRDISWSASMQIIWMQTINIADLLLRTYYCGLTIADLLLRTYYCGLTIAD
jgi:hypothetical protein